MFIRGTKKHSNDAEQKVKERRKGRQGGDKKESHFKSDTGKNSGHD